MALAPTLWELLGQTERIPPALKAKALLKNLKRGDYHSASSDGITVTIQKDTEDVSFISDVHSSRA